MCWTGDIGISCMGTIFRRFWEFKEKEKADFTLEDITIDDVIRFFEFLSTSRFVPNKKISKPKPLQHNTRMKYIRTLKDFFRWCSFNWYTTIKRQLFPKWKKKETEIDVLTEEEVQKFFNLCKKEKSEIVRTRNELFLRVAYYTGIRYSENLSLTFDKVLSGEPFQIKQKWGRVRTVSIRDNSWIRQLALQLKTLYGFKKKKYLADEDYLYLNVSNQWIGKKRWIDWPRFELEKYKKILKINKHITMHTFRHSHATHLLNRWADLKSVQISLWHKFITTTEVYAHLSPRILNTTLDLLWEYR
jgi:site-specific recombinase XerD